MTEPTRDGSRDRESWDGEWPPSQRQRVWWGITLVLIGVVWLLLALDVDVAWDLVLPVSVVTVGVLVLVLGRRVRGDGLINLGVVVALAALLVTFVPGAITLTAGERDHRYTDVTELADEHGLGAGRMTIDLRSIDLPDGVTRVPAGVTFGELVVLVPSDVAVTGSANIAIGQIDVLGDSDGGLGRTKRFDEPGAADDGPVLELELGVGFGRIEVRR